MGCLWLLLLGTETNKVNIFQNPYKQLPSLQNLSAIYPLLNFTDLKTRSC